MDTCIIKLEHGKWHCYGPDGTNWCAYDKKEWAIDCGKTHGWKIQIAS